MHTLATGLALLLALGIIVIGNLYLFSPTTAARGFGLPLPESGTNIPWWLRLKGVRDIASGLTVLALMVWGSPLAVGVVLLAETFIPVGDMLLVLAAKGSTKSALGMHAVTALVMVATAIALIARAH